MNTRDTDEDTLIDDFSDEYDDWRFDWEADMEFFFGWLCGLAEGAVIMFGLILLLRSLGWF